MIQQWKKQDRINDTVAPTMPISSKKVMADRPTYGPTDRPTDIVAYRVASSRLKKRRERTDRCFPRFHHRRILIFLGGIVECCIVIAVVNVCHSMLIYCNCCCKNGGWHKCCSVMSSDIVSVFVSVVGVRVCIVLWIISWAETHRWTIESLCKYLSAEARSRNIPEASLSVYLVAEAMASKRSPPKTG